MRTLADFKRKLQPGSVWNCYNHIQRKDMGNRPVATVQSKAVSFQTPNGESWLEYPRAGAIRFSKENTVDIYDSLSGALLLTYTLVTNGGPS